MLKRIWALFVARNIEFITDKSGLGWTLLFPFLVIGGFSLIFSDSDRALYKAGIISGAGIESSGVAEFMDRLEHNTQIDKIRFVSEKKALEKLGHHDIQIVINPSKCVFYTSKTSAKSIAAESLVFYKKEEIKGFRKENIEGIEIPYVEWLFPGVLGMNMMFSALFGVGYTVVRYRKNGMLKRLSVTPVKPFEFLFAHVVSRIFIMLSTTTIVFLCCTFLYGFECRGSVLLLFTVFTAGGFSMISLGLILAARGSSEELAGGLLNLISWPMMFLSGVWFSLEGTAPWVKKLSSLFPLTHLISAARDVMNDGASAADVAPDIFILLLMAFCFISIGSIMFQWGND